MREGRKKDRTEKRTLGEEKKETTLASALIKSPSLFLRLLSPSLLFLLSILFASLLILSSSSPLRLPSLSSFFSSSSPLHPPSLSSPFSLHQCIKGSNILESVVCKVEMCKLLCRRRKTLETHRQPVICKLQLRDKKKEER